MNDGRHCRYYEDKITDFILSIGNEVNTNKKQKKKEQNVMNNKCNDETFFFVYVTDWVRITCITPSGNTWTVHTYMHA